ncbi:MAG: S41 family peptidase [Chitinispirillaceae bacterium]
MEKTSNQPARKFFGRAPFVGMVVLFVVITGLVMDSTRADGDNFYAEIHRLDNVVTKVHQNYVEDLNSEEMVDNAIKGMLGELDPHTTYLEEKASEELRIQTDGKFGGLGIQISIRDEVLTVMTPISGTPASRAGIQSGDQIVKIEGKSTEGITVDDAVEKLRGEPGTKVNITVRRKGAPKTIDYEITREIIRLKSVPFSGVLDNGIGYIKLTQFSKDAGVEVEKALNELLEKDIKGLVFDLRHNPGGLLPQAIEVAEKFLPRKSLVVSTRGRVSGQNKEFYSSSSPVLPSDMPLAVLVDYASASASEIVSGAVQDWDRGLVVGDTTFGKGSVQSVVPLDATHLLKLTTAYYYTPAGRCINRREKSDSTKNGGEKDEDSESQNDNETYRTNNGRLVCGGGGIVPDTIVKQKIPDMAIRAMYGKDVFFQFANMEYVRLKKRNVEIGENYKLDDATMKDFYMFLDSIDFTYESEAQAKLEEFKKKSGLVEDTSGTEKKDSFMESPELTDSEKSKLEAAAAQMESVLNAESRRSLKKNNDEIKRLVHNALLVRALGQDHDVVYKINMKDDEQLEKAIELLSDKELYSSLLKPRKRGQDEKKEKKEVQKESRKDTQENTDTK